MQMICSLNFLKEALRASPSGRDAVASLLRVVCGCLPNFVCQIYFEVFPQFLSFGTVFSFSAFVALICFAPPFPLSGTKGG